MKATYIPAEEDGDNAGLPLGDLHEGRLGHVEVGAGRVAPPAMVGVLGPIGRAEIGGRDGGDGRILIAILRFRAPHLEALPAPVPVVEQHRAQCRRVRAVSSAEQVAVPTSPTYN